MELQRGEEGPSQLSVHGCRAAGTEAGSCCVLITGRGRGKEPPEKVCETLE